MIFCDDQISRTGKKGSATGLYVGSYLLSLSILSIDSA